MTLLTATSRLKAGATCLWAVSSHLSALAAGPLETPSSVVETPPGTTYAGCPVLGGRRKSLLIRVIHDIFHFSLLYHLMQSVIKIPLSVSD